MRRLALVGAGLVLLGGLTACGGSPDDASKDDFCKAFSDSDAIAGDDFDKIKKWGEKLDEVGTPKEIEGDAREGYELFVDLIDEADDEKDAKKLGDDISKDDEKKIDKFTEDAAELCAS